MRDEFGARNPKSMMLRFHTQTAGVQLTAQQPEVNLVRVTVQALAAVLGGTQSLHTNSYDEAIALPTEKAARLALRTQQVIAHETDLTATVDPFAGSFAVEAMTDDIEAEIRRLMAAVEDLGGAVAAIEAGYQKREIERAAYDVDPVDRGRQPGRWSGVNKFVRDDDEDLRAAAGRSDDRGPAVRAAGHAAGRARQRGGDPPPRRAKAAAADPDSGVNLLYPMHDALRARATVGEVCNALREVWGAYEPSDACERSIRDLTR